MDQMVSLDNNLLSSARPIVRNPITHRQLRHYPTIARSSAIPTRSHLVQGESRWQLLGEHALANPRLSRIDTLAQVFSYRP